MLPKLDSRPLFFCSPWQTSELVFRFSTTNFRNYKELSVAGYIIKVKTRSNTTKLKKLPCILSSFLRKVHIGSPSSILMLGVWETNNSIGNKEGYNSMGNHCHASLKKELIIYAYTTDLTFPPLKQMTNPFCNSSNPPNTHHDHPHLTTSFIPNSLAFLLLHNHS